MADHPDLPELPGEVVSEAQAAYIESCHKEGEDERPAYAAFKASFKSPHAAAKMALSAAHGSGWGDDEGADLIRDIYGNPFRPVAVDPSWLTSTVLELAQHMYESRDFSPMPILSDALQDAGCDNDDILNHCRQPGEHFRGCWVVDLLTGRK